MKMIIRMVVEVIVAITPIVISHCLKNFPSSVCSCKNQVVIKLVTYSKLDFYTDTSFGREIVHWI